MTKFYYLSNVVTLDLDTSKCTGCKLCIYVCPHEVFAIENKKAVIIDRDACMECGACANNCEYEALTVKSGVGCSAAIINGYVRGTEPNCDCCCGDQEEDNTRA